MTTPPRTVARPHKCGALADRSDPTVHCGDEARLYACGWRCRRHEPGANRTNRDEVAVRANESITFDALIAEAPSTAVAEVIKAGARTAPTGDALVMDVINRRGCWLDQLDTEALRDEWRHYQALTTTLDPEGPSQ
jgi:hypothetical protein